MPDTSLSHNPAERLLRICRLIRDFEASAQTRTAWAHIMGISEDDVSRLLPRIGAVFALIEQTESTLRRIEGLDHERFLQWKPTVSNALKQLNMVDQKIASVKNLLAPEALTHLEYCAYEISKYVRQGDIETETCSRLLEQVAKLSSEVMNASISAELKSFLLSKLDLIERALELYPIQGTQPIEDALDSMLGGMKRQGAEAFREIRESEVFDALWEFLHRVATVLELAQAYDRLLEWVSQLKLPENLS
jgi:hypothetical protein